MMKIEDFPRPPDDNGRGIHWSATPYHVTGDELDHWVGEVVAMHIKWVKLMDDGGGSSQELCLRLLDNGIMPIVRIFKPEPNPGHMVEGREEEMISRFVSQGIRYFETNNEPDLPVEWYHGVMPDNWLEIVVDSFIIDASKIIDRGGLPAFPAMGPGGREDPYDMIVAKGRQDLFENGAWVAIHNYTLNHPLDYPYDDVNQNGTPLTQEEYERDGEWAWDRNPLHLINEWRANDKNPGQTIHDDANCFLGYRYYHDIVVQALGFSVPIITTEGGPVIGDRQDRRYPRMTPEMHKRMTLGIMNHMAHEAPDWYFAYCHWLIANKALGYYTTQWETQAWYTDTWQVDFGITGQIPTVAAVKALPSVSRLGPRQSVIEGTITDEAGNAQPGLPLNLIREGQIRGNTTTDANGGFRFDGLGGGSYELAIAERGVIKSGIAVDGENRVTVTLTLPRQQSAISGQVKDTTGTPKAGLTVSLSSDGQAVVSTTTDAEGRFHFGFLPAGNYALAVEGQARAEVQLADDETKTVEVVIPTPLKVEYQVVTKRLLPEEETAGRNIIYGRVTDEAGEPLDGILVEMSWNGAEPGTTFPTTRTGADAGKPRGYFEFMTTRGEFRLKVVQGDHDSQVADGLRTVGVPGRESGAIAYEVNFQLKSVGGPTEEPGEEPSEEPGKPLYHCLLLGDPATPNTVVNLTMAEEYIMAFQPAISFQPDEAVQARYVTIVGDVAVDESRLAAAGCQFERLSGTSQEIEAAFADLVQQGQRFRSLQAA